MSVIIINKAKAIIVNFGRESIRTLGRGGGGWGTEGGVGVVNNASVNIHEVGDVFVAVVEIISNIVGGGEEDEGTGGDRFRGIPDVGVEESIICALELLDAEVVVVDKALERFYAILHRAHFNAATHAVEGHRDHSVAGLPADGAVFGIVGDRPNAGLGLDEGLISIVVVLGDEIINRGVLVEVVGRVSFAFGGGAISDVIVIVGDLVGGDEFVADVVAVLFVVLGDAAAKAIISVPIDGVDVVCHGGAKVARRLVGPDCLRVVWITESVVNLAPPTPWKT